MYKLFFSQKIPIGLLEAWNFFSSPANLEKITPSELGLKIQNGNEVKKMYAGQIITYTVQPIWKINFEWVTEITAVQEPDYFIDEQRFGPYSFWHHEHRFTAIPEGTLIEDIIYYKVPFGIIGKVFNHLKIKKDINRIFAYRCKFLTQHFGSCK